MLRLAAFLVFSACLLTPIECQKKTRINVPYNLKCNGPFTFTIKLVETDGLFNPNDILATQTMKATNEYNGVLFGTDDGDDGSEYELEIRIEHTCGGPAVKWIEKKITSKACKVTDDQCNFPMEKFQLRPGAFMN